MSRARLVPSTFASNFLQQSATVTERASRRAPFVKLNGMSEGGAILSAWLRSKPPTPRTRTLLQTLAYKGEVEVDAIADCTGLALDEINRVVREVGRYFDRRETDPIRSQIQLGSTRNTP